MKVVVTAFNQEKALVGAFFMVVKTDCENRWIVSSTRCDGEIRSDELVAGAGRLLRAG